MPRPIRQQACLGQDGRTGVSRRGQVILRKMAVVVGCGGCWGHGYVRSSWRM